jgi:hypothetical protein
MEWVSDRKSFAQIFENGALQYGLDSFVFRGMGKWVLLE